MGSRTYRSWSSRSSRSARIASTPSSRSSSRYSYVEQNFRVETPVVPEVHIQRKLQKSREITINDSPMMLLPKARVRESLDYYDQFRRPYGGIVADTDTQGLHISTIQSVTGMESRIAPKSALKIRKHSISRSEADSGFCSLKRSVTFENLSRSQSTVFRSDDEFENLSESSGDEKDDEPLFRLPPEGAESDALPDYLESFDNGAPIIANPPQIPPRPPSRNSHPQKKKRRRHGEFDDHDPDECEICGVVLSDIDRVKKSFGKVDTFLDWVMSKWGKRTELQYIPRPNYVYRGHTPHFCNFVQQVQLHSKNVNGTESTGIPDSDIGDEIDFVMESTEGRLISKYRKSSNARWRDLSHPLHNKKLNYGSSHDPLSSVSQRNSMFVFNQALYSSIPEIKEDGLISGTEGRPGSPSSLDGESHQDDSPKQPVTEVRVSSPVKSEPGVKTTVVIKIDTKPKIEEKPTPSSSKGDQKTILEEKEEKTPQEKPLNAWDNDNKSGSGDSVVIPRSDVDDRPPSPREPPPSPDLSKKPEPVEKTPSPSTTPKKRGCATKKTKKPVERTRKMKAIEEPKEVGLPTTEDFAPPAAQDGDSDKLDIKVDVKVPELPSNKEKKEKQKKDKSKPKRHLIETEDDLYRPDANEILNEQMKLNRSEFDWSNMETNGIDDVKRPPQIKSWIQGRLALSQQSSRFELPMDMKKLETMTPQEYIRKHCIITSRRQNLYQKIFLKNKEKSQTIVFKDLDKSLKDVLVNTITSEQIQGIFKELEVDENTRVDYKLFSGLAAYSERVLYPKFVTEDTHDMPEYQREKIECADFCALDWKIHGVKLSKQMHDVLKKIC